MPQVHAQAGIELLLERLAGGTPAVRHVRGHLRIRGSTERSRRPVIVPARAPFHVASVDSGLQLARR